MTFTGWGKTVLSLDQILPSLSSTAHTMAISARLRPPVNVLFVLRHSCCISGLEMNATTLASITVVIVAIFCSPNITKLHKPIGIVSTYRICMDFCIVLESIRNLHERYIKQSDLNQLQNDYKQSSQMSGIYSETKNVMKKDQNRLVDLIFLTPFYSSKTIVTTIIGHSTNTSTFHIHFNTNNLIYYEILRDYLILMKTEK